MLEPRSGALTCAGRKAVGGCTRAGRIEDAALLRAPAAGAQIDEVLHEGGTLCDVCAAQRRRLWPNACSMASYCESAKDTWRLTLCQGADMPHLLTDPNLACMQAS